MSTEPVTPESGAIEYAASNPLFLYIPVSRLIWLSIVSFGLYEVYWIYRNWRYIKDREGLKIRPFWRGIFGIFFVSSLMTRIRDDEKMRAVVQPSFSPVGLAVGYIILVILSSIVARAPGFAATVISGIMPSYLCLRPVQLYVNSVTERASPGVPYYPFSTGHIVCLVLGSLGWLVSIIAVLMPK